VSVRDCRIGGLGAHGVELFGSQLSVAGNVVADVGCKGVVVVGGDYLSLTRANNSVTHNDISRFSRWKRSYQPGLFWAGVGNAFSYNNISFGPHNAILGGGNEAAQYSASLGGCDNLFEHNAIWNTTFEVSDSGSFYTVRGSTAAMCCAIIRGRTFAIWCR